MPALFPFKLTLPDGTLHDPVKVFADGRTVRVWGTPNGRTPEIVAQADGVMERTEGGWRVAAPDGDWLLAPARGCGCGHPLKRFQPPRQVPA